MKIGQEVYIVIDKWNDPMKQDSYGRYSQTEATVVSFDDNTVAVYIPFDISNHKFPIMLFLPRERVFDNWDATQDYIKEHRD